MRYIDAEQDIAQMSELAELLFLACQLLQETMTVSTKQSAQLEYSYLSYKSVCLSTYVLQAVKSELSTSSQQMFHQEHRAQHNHQSNKTQKCI